jgi:hypothetical protein
MWNEAEAAVNTTDTLSIENVFFNHGRPLLFFKDLRPVYH